MFAACIKGWRVAGCWMTTASLNAVTQAVCDFQKRDRDRKHPKFIACVGLVSLLYFRGVWLLHHVGMFTTVGGISDVQRPFSVEPKYEFGCVPEMLKHFLVPSFPCRCNLRKDRREKGRCLPCYLIDCLNADRQAEAHHVAAAACVRRRRVRKCALGTSIATLSSPWSRLQHHHHCCLELLRFLIADD